MGSPAGSIGASSPEVDRGTGARRSDRQTINLAGAVDTAAMFRLEHRLYGLRAQRRRDMVVDLTRVTSIGANTMRALVGTLRRLDRSDARVSVIAGSSRMSRTFELAGASGFVEDTGEASLDREESIDGPGRRSAASGLLTRETAPPS